MEGIVNCFFLSAFTSSIIDTSSATILTPQSPRRADHRVVTRESKEETRSNPLTFRRRPTEAAELKVHPAVDVAWMTSRTGLERLRSSVPRRLSPIIRFRSRSSTSRLPTAVTQSYSTRSKLSPAEPPSNSPKEFTEFPCS